jgi:hypothetical protein
MITKDIATSLTHGQILHHTTFKNADEVAKQLASEA